MSADTLLRNMLQLCMKVLTAALIELREDLQIKQVNQGGRKPTRDSALCIKERLWYDGDVVQARFPFWHLRATREIDRKDSPEKAFR